MAIATILRRSASKLAPLAARFSGGSKNFHSLSTGKSVAQTHVSGKVVIPTSFSSLRHYSALPKKTSSDDSLLKVIESEIVCAEESDDSNEVMEVPENFPFKIEDNPGQQTISLSRKYQDETIEVEVHMPDLVTGEDDNENDDDDDDDEKPTQSHIPLVVRVNRNHKFILEFGCTAYPDEISIDSLSVRNPETTEDEIAYEGPDFSDLDENLQKAFHKYLEIRGIKPSTTNFLHEYMINKDSREYVTWLKNLKNFVQA